MVYNPGERVLGTTTPLYAILLSGAALLAGGVNAPFPEIALALNALFDPLTCLLLIYLGKRLGYPAAGAGAALAWAVAPFSVTFAAGGLEASLYVLLLTGTAAAHVDKRHRLAAFLAALSLLTRPDALILIGLIALDRFPGWSRKPSLGEALAFLLPAASWLLFASLYYGSPLPHSIAAKSLAYRLPPEAAFVRLVQHYATPFLEHLSFGVPAIAAGLVLYPFLSILGIRVALRAERSFWPFALYPWAYFAVFALANPLIFRWYLTPPLPAYILIILIGLEKIIQDLAKDHQRLANAALSLAVAAPLILSLRGWVLRPDHGLETPAPEMAYYELELLYDKASEIVKSAIQERNTVEPGFEKPDLADVVLAAGDVGVLGYETGVRILDLVGLNSPEAVKYYPLDPDLYVINYAAPPQLVLDEQPDFVVILEVYGRRGLLREPAFQSGYALLEKIPTDMYGSDGLLVFQRIKD
jgi:hypothetical protein